MIEHHNHTDERAWDDQKLVDWHNELVEVINDPDTMPRRLKEALGEIACVRFEIDHRTIDIIEEEPI